MSPNMKKNTKIPIETFSYSDELPFVEAPTYKEYRFDEKDEKYKKYSDELNKNSFCIVDLELEKNLIDQVNQDIDEAIRKNSIRLNSRAYHYNENPRIVEIINFNLAFITLNISI